VYLTHLSLTNFRNYVRLELELPARIIVLQGENAQGKTNLLEAIYYLATTRSPYASADRQLINWQANNEEIPFARLAAQVQRGGELHRIEITLMRTIRPGGAIETASLRRSFKLNGVNKRAMDLLGQINVVMFLPEDINLIPGAPSERRRHLDATICQFDPLYCRNLQRYTRVLAQRNHLLRDLRERQGDYDQLIFWDQRLVEWGSYVIARRMIVLNRTAQIAARIHLELTGRQEQLDIRYLPTVQLDSLLDVAPQMTMTQMGKVPRDLLQHTSRQFAAQLARRRREEILRGMTLVGPHRDDVRFVVNGVDMGIYGSRGQQRTTTLSLKLAEVELMHEETGENPILLLDDVLSELDRARCEYLLDAIDTAQQAIITTTDMDFYPSVFLQKSVLWHVHQGTIEEVTSSE